MKRFLVVCLLLLLPKLAWGAISFVQTDNSTGTSTCVISSFTVSAGNSLVIVTFFSSTAYDVSSISITSESNATLTAKHTQSGYAYAFRAGYLADITTGGSKTITVTYNGGANGLCTAIEYTGTDTSTFHDDTAAGGSASGDPMTATVTTTAANDLIVACGGSVSYNQGSYATPSGYTIRQIGNSSSAFQCWDNVDVGSAAAKQVDSDLPAADTYLMHLEAFFAGAGGGGAAPSRRGQLY